MIFDPINETDESQISEENVLTLAIIIQVSQFEKLDQCDGNVQKIILLNPLTNTQVLQCFNQMLNLISGSFL